MKLGEYIYNVNESEIEYKEELQAIYDSRKSFYKKAFVLYLTNGDIALQSYSTIVAIYHVGGIFESEKYSQTTNRHIREFEKQFDGTQSSILDYDVI